MGRPPGSKNKRTLEKEEKHIKKVVEKTLKKELPESKKIQTIVQATVDLALLVARVYIHEKIDHWKKHLEHDRLEVISSDDSDEFRLYLNNEFVQSKHVFKVDVEDVVRGVLGLR